MKKMTIFANENRCQHGTRRLGLTLQSAARQRRRRVAILKKALLTLVL